MFKRSKLNTRIYAPTHRWRNYQVKLRKQSAQEKAIRRLPIYLMALVVLIGLTKGAFLLYDWAFLKPQPAQAELETASVQPLDRKILPKLLANTQLTDITRETFHLNAGTRKYRIATSIMPSLQQVITDNIDRKYAKYFGFVAIEPETGKIIAMVSFDKTGADSNVC